MKILELKRLAALAIPGPWKHEVNESSERGTGVIWQTNADEGSSHLNVQMVAEVYYASYRLKPWKGCEGEEFESTSEYIAACSPDVITALCKDWLAMRKVLKKIGDGKWPHNVSVCDFAREAIAQIETMGISK